MPTQYKAGSGPPVPPKCVHCDRPHQSGGPIYSDPIHDTAFVAGLLKDVEATEADNKYGTFKRMQGFLSVSKRTTDRDHSGVAPVPL